MLRSRNDLKSLTDIAMLNVSNHVKPVKDAIIDPTTASVFAMQGKPKPLVEMTMAFLFVKVINKLFGLNYHFAPKVTFAFLLYKTIQKVKQKIGR